MRNVFVNNSIILLNGFSVYLSQFLVFKPHGIVGPGL